ncbi:hypothetical protein P691DRAFT_718317 [Macrolepiota fuliginosa MF-IS2]|uniref:Uncharacterized protein n=1 Tax=Macrolepiota fuliginosa MF-IS2 TaxID=1400762 RepID=A0A9P6CAB1_9AGAR|nr:hypothetical protein P691DRAFT_718317 [Macrolepiota fuliginosa MF-IS2]
MPLKVSAQFTLANASPSVALEKGAYYRTRTSRTRGGATLNTPNPYTHRHAQSRNTQSTKVVALLLLAFACITCFGTAYYLFKTRWENPEHHPTRVPHTNALPVQVNVSIYDNDLQEHDAYTYLEERYLAYLPHSGFHNQRIAFENALVLARLLNRTLIVPPIRLGNKPIPYYPFDRLSRMLALADKTGLQHCAHVLPGLSMPPECLDYFDYTYLPWDSLIDLTSVRASQKLRYRWNFAENWFRDTLGIPDSRMLMFRDHKPYQYRFVDNIKRDLGEKNWYTEDVSISYLIEQPQALLIFGSLFGSTRLQFREQEYLDVRKEVREAMSIKHPILDRVSESIWRALGGAYLAIHFRTGESKFEDASEANARAIWWALLHRFLNISMDDTIRLENGLQRTGTSPNLMGPGITAVPSLPSYYLPLSDTEKFYLDLASRKTCHQRFSHVPALDSLGQNSIALYIATDLKNPTKHPLFSRFRILFPCIFDLSDFASYLSPLDQLINPLDGVPLRSHFTPFIDALVAARAFRVAGTQGSTFSYYIEDVLWKRNHNLPIKQRG